MQEFPGLGILILSVSCDMTVIREALTKGARGYASKDINKNELLRGIQSVAAGAYFLDQTALTETIRMIVFPGKKILQGVLTARELDVARIYVNGKTIREIATLLFISEDTVESHIKNIRSKTACTSRYEVEQYLRKNNLAEE
jgi:DNA-binding NarL/FixJ family response regulator